MKTKALIILCILLSVCPWLSNVYGNSRNNTIVLQLKWYHQFQFAGYYAAYEKGFYAREGLTVEIRPANYSTNVIEEIEKGRADIGVSGPDIVSHYLSGSPIVALAAINQHSPLVVLTSKNSGIVNPQQLVSKRLMLVSEGDDEVRTMLRNEGVLLENIQILPHSFNPEDLIQGEVDAISAYVTNEPYYFSNRDFPVNSIEPINYGVDFYGDCLFAHADFAKENPAQIARFLKATFQGWEYALNHKEELVKLIKEKYNSEKSVEHLLYEAQQIEKLISPELVKIGHMNPWRWNMIAEVLYDGDVKKEQAYLKGFIYKAEHPAAFFSKTTLLIFGIVFLVVLAIVLVLFVFNKQLQKKVLQKTIALRQSEERFRLAINGTNDGIWDWNIEKGTFFVSKQFAAVLGIDVKELSMKSNALTYAVHADDIERVSNEISQYLSGRCLEYETEFRVINANNEIVWVSRKGKALLDGSGKATRFIGFQSDISSRKATESAMKKSKKLLQEAERIGRIGAWVWSIKDDAWQVSENWLNIHGVDQRPKSFEEVKNYIHPDDYQRVEKAFQGYKQSAILNPIEYRIIQPGSGNQRIVRVYAEVLVENDVPILITGAVQDITKLKLIENQLLNQKEKYQALSQKYYSQNEALKEKIGLISEMNVALVEAKTKAEESDRLKSVFLANISHEIRTPMNGILGFAELLKKPDLSIDDQDKYLYVIKESGNRMLDIINDLIDISKIEANQIKLAKEKEELNALMEYLYEFFLPEAKAKGLELFINISSTSKTVVAFIDKTRVLQVYANLIKNAIKYTEKGHIRVTLEVKKDEIIFVCSDTGVGIPEEKMKFIFERFGQLEYATERQIEGTGLGLTITKALVELMNGSISVHSVPHRGSRFMVRIPSEVQDTDQIEKYTDEANRKPMEQNISVLVVDDDIISYTLLKEALAGTAKTIDHAKTGKEAVGLILENPGSYNVVLMDIKMPDMDGFEATREIKERLPELPIIIQTAFATAEDRLSAKNAGADNFMAKPLQIPKLLSVIEALTKNPR
jgi:PAS domain S-box-containing protein